MASRIIRRTLSRNVGQAATISAKSASTAPETAPLSAAACEFPREFAIVLALYRPLIYFSAIVRI
jgi:hypothetical protein